jgi:ubiquinone/menaquinone biosynthesis C-methylase UbiE
MIVAEDAYRLLLLEEVTSSTAWLDLGCGWRLLREWLPHGNVDQEKLSGRARHLVGIDAVIEDVSRNPYVHDKVAGNILSLPFQHESFDLVTAQMVIEHLQQPMGLLREVRRVLRDGGKFIFLTPNYRNYQVFSASLLPDKLKKRIVGYFEWREETDIFPTYYRMNTAKSVRSFAENSGFSVEKISMVHSSFEFTRFPPLHWVEKALHQILDTNAFANYRADILAVLVKRNSKQI